MLSRWRQGAMNGVGSGGVWATKQRFLPTASSWGRLSYVWQEHLHTGQWFSNLSVLQRHLEGWITTPTPPRPRRKSF